MSSDPPKDPPPDHKKLHVWGRPLDSPAPAAATPGQAAPPAAQGDKPALAGEDFHQNFPEATGGISLSEAVKSIKADDFLEVHKSACGRQGLMTGIVVGALAGGLRFVWRGAPLRAANWAAGGFVAGATASFERCQYLRRLERISMKRIVEVHQSDVAEKKRLKEEEAKKQAAEAAARRAWYKFW